MFNVKQFILSKINIAHLTQSDTKGYNKNMKAGLVADIIVAAIIVINLIVCTRLGFVRCVLQFFSTILALSVALLSATPIANFCNKNWNWTAAIEKWHIPFISAETILKLLIGIAVFVLVRLVCILIDKLLRHLKEKLKAVNIIDRILGTVFGCIAALFELTLAFIIINQFGWASALSLTADAGGFFAYRLFEFCRTYMFNIIGKIFAMASASTPKI